MRNSSEFAEPTTAVDLWSAGIIFYELYTKERPFSDEPGRLTLKSYYTNPCLPTALERSFASAIGQDCIRRFLEPDPLTRITAEEAILTHWLVEVPTESTDLPTSAVIANIEEAIASFNLDQGDTRNPWGGLSGNSGGRDPNASSTSLATSATLVNESDYCLTPMDPRSRTPIPPGKTISKAQHLSVPGASVSGGSSAEPSPVPSRSRTPQAFQTYQQPILQEPVYQNFGPIDPPQVQNYNRRTSNTPSHASGFSAKSAATAPSMPRLTKTVSAPNPPLPPRRSTASGSVPRYPPEALREQQFTEAPSQARPTLPPRRRVSAPSVISTPPDQQTRWQPPSCERVYEGSEASEEYIEQTIDPSEHDTGFETETINEEIVQPSWLLCAYESTELRMSMGPIPYQPEKPPTCDHCDEEVMLRGPRANANIQAPLFSCETCGKGRQLCERCAQIVIKKPGDPHEADHILRRVGPGVSLELENFLRDPEIDVQMAETVPPTYGGNWIASDHGFEAPVQAGAQSLRAQFFLTVPPGIYNVIVHLRISFNPARISSETLGTATKRRMKSFKEAYGYLDVGAESCSVDVDKVDKLYQRFMPEAAIRQAVFYSSGQMDQNITVRLKQPMQVQPGKQLMLAVKSSHDPSVFKRGCPFRWHLSFVSLNQFGPKTQLATRGQLIRREQIVENQKAQDRHMMIDRRIGYANKLLAVGNNLTALGQAGAAISTKLARKRDYESSALNHQYSALNNYASAYNHVNNPSVYGHQGHSSEYGGDDSASFVGGGASDATYVWVSEQASQPFVASFEAVEYSDGSASASYVQYGLR